MLVDLSTTPFPEVLLRLSAGRRSGDLVVRHQRAVKTVFFDRGRLVFAASNLKKDRLGEALVALGRITDEQLKLASLLMGQRDRRKRFGEALVEAGVMDRGELGTAVARQVRLIAVSLFSLAGGVASFDDRPCAIPVEYMVALSLHQVIYAGIKSMADERLLLSGLGDLERQVRLSRVPPFKFPVQRCPALEREILEQAGRLVSLEQLVSEDGAPSFQRLRAVYALFASGVLELGGTGVGDEPIVQAGAGTFLLSTLRREPEPSLHEALRLEVEQEAERSARLDVEGWLAVAPPEEIARAVEEKMERFHAMLASAREDEQLRTNIELILGRAYVVLRRVRSPSAAGGGPVADREQPQLPTLLPTSQTAAVPASAPETAPAGPPAAKSASAVAPDPARRVEAAPAPEAPPAVAAAAPAASAPSLMDVERALREGDVRMTISDYANAVTSYSQLVDSMPNVPLYRLKLAIAMACWPRTAKQAERQFLEAMRLKPNDATLHYQFGLYYKAMKQRGRALTEIRTALSLDPRHAQARRELEVLSPRDTNLFSLKKLFRR